METKNLLNVSVGRLELSIRSRRALRAADIKVLHDLLIVTEADLLQLQNFGQTSLREISAALGKHGLMIGQSVPNEDQQLPEFARAKLRQLNIRTLQQVSQFNHCSLRMIVGTEIDAVKAILKTRGLSLADGEPLDHHAMLGPKTTFWEISHILPTRLRNVLLQAGWSPEMTLKEMSEWDHTMLYAIKGLAETGVSELRVLLDKAGMEFGSRSEEFAKRSIENDDDVRQALSDAGRQARLLKQPVTVLNLSVRAKNCLEATRIKTLADLTSRTSADLLRYRSFGKTALLEIEFKLAERGLYLADSPEEQLFDSQHKPDEVMTRKVQATIGRDRKLNVEVEVRAGTLIVTPANQEPITFDYEDSRLKVRTGSLTLNVERRL